MPQGNLIYGWYDDPDQPINEPTSNPPLDAVCLYCGHQISPDDMRTINLMPLTMPKALRRSYFYRTHRTCAERCNLNVDAIVLEMITRNGD